MIRTFLLSVFAFAICSSAQAADPYVTGTYRPVSQGWRAEFTLHNALADKSLSWWRVVTADAWNLSAPASWTAQQDFRQVEWGADSVSYRVQPGVSLGGFGFTSQVQTTSYDWFILTSTGGGYIGTVTPDLVPEPSALLALAGGLGVLGLPFIRRTR